MLLRIQQIFIYHPPPAFKGGGATQDENFRLDNMKLQSYNKNATRDEYDGARVP